MNMFKKNGGFTLVELIVVIAILAILAGVAVPAYTGYINRANEAADLATCDAAKTAVFAALAEEGKDFPDTMTINSGSAPTAEGLTAAKFTTYYGAATVTLKNHSKAVWQNGAWTLTPNS